jgi:glucose/arabinose dehydrogenase
LADGDNNGQRRDTLLGAFLRLDIDRTENGLNYAIPPDNPFVGNTEGWREEIWAWGFRNPWRYAFDPVTGILWTSDTGESSREEIDIVQRGRNYAWRIMEGTTCFLVPNCDRTGLTLPVYEYGGDMRREAVIGGSVYRGKRNPEFVGLYIFTDFLRGEIWALAYDGANPTVRTTLATGFLDISSFGVDEDDELYFVNQIAGTVHRFQPTALPVQSSTWSDLKRRYRR